MLWCTKRSNENQVISLRHTLFWLSYHSKYPNSAKETIWDETGWTWDGETCCQSCVKGTYNFWKSGKIGRHFSSLGKVREFSIFFQKSGNFADTVFFYFDDTTGLPRVREKSGKNKIFSRSGNCQGILKKCQGILAIWLMSGKCLGILSWQLNFSKND